MYIDNGIIIQNADTSLRVYLYRGKLKSKRKRLPRREMPFFSGGQNKGGLFANSGHKLLYKCINPVAYATKYYTKNFCKKGSFSAF